MNSSNVFIFILLIVRISRWDKKRHPSQPPHTKIKSNQKVEQNDLDVFLSLQLADKCHFLKIKSSSKVKKSLGLGRNVFSQSIGSDAKVDVPLQFIIRYFVKAIMPAPRPQIMIGSGHPNEKLI